MWVIKSLLIGVVICLSFTATYVFRSVQEGTATSLGLIKEMTVSQPLYWLALLLITGTTLFLTWMCRR